jgi:uncharacterized YigZ family protein
MTDSYLSIRAPASARITRERSRFIGLLFPGRNEEEVSRILERVRKEHHGASHRPFAYRLFRDASVLARAEDAGEPKGTAGAPILRELEAAGLFDLVAVVVRYFGGVKLGRGGLARAYANATHEAIAAAALVETRRDVRVAVRFPPELGSGVMGLVRRHATAVEAVDYTQGGRLLVLLPPSRLARFAAELAEATGARAHCEEEP